MYPDTNTNTRSEHSVYPVLSRPRTADSPLPSHAVNVIINIIVGLLFPIFCIINAVCGDVPCIPGEGATEKAIIAHYKKYWYGSNVKNAK